MPPPPPAPLVKGSLTPVYRLLPQSEYARLGGSDARFTSAAVGVSVETKLDEIAQQIAADRALAAAPEIIDAADRTRARGIPFRGNPSDVLRVPSSTGELLMVPLGGDQMTPGNEVAIVETSPALRLRGHVTVGVRPQRLALHPAGLVFVCNQYSNYVSILDPEIDAPLARDGEEVLIGTDYHCADLAFAPRNAAQPDPDQQFLYIANRWRRSVLKYAIDVVRDANGAVINVVQSSAQAPAPLAEISDVGSTPTRLWVDAAADAVFVANHRGGRVARIAISTDRVSAGFDVGAPAIDVRSIGDRIFVPTTMPDRGLLASDEPARSGRVEAAPLVLTGLDGAAHQAHPGRLLDGTRSYNFEDVRNGLFELDASLTPRVYYTDDISAEPNFGAEQKLLAGALPQALIRNQAGDRLYIALGGSDLVQELVVAQNALLPGVVFETRERPFALSIDETLGRLYVVSWGGEVLEYFDLADGSLLGQVDLGYALPTYPATDVETGERHYYDAAWSNNGRKTCAHCHYDELISDGVGFSNGVTAPTALHRVKPNYDLLTTDSYFWNGSFDDGSYRSAAFAAQIRTNCELILFGMIEGPASDPALRIGDPANAFRDDGATGDALCRPQAAPQGTLPPGFAEEIAPVIAAEKALAALHVQDTTGLDPDALSDVIDFYSAAELRLPPNPHDELRGAGELDAATLEQLSEGEKLFEQAGCAGCHQPLNPRHPFTYGGDEGSGADWTARFAAAYANDARVLDAIPTGLPDLFTSSIRTNFPTTDVNVHLDPIDFFTPFCFTEANCLAFEDPLEAGIGLAEETRRLDFLLRFNLADPDRGFIPGSVPGQVKVNVPSLRGVWTQANLLHHGLAQNVRQAILAPGHPALSPGETGFGVDKTGRFDTHGITSNLTPAEVDALVLYVNSIE